MAHQDGTRWDGTRWAPTRDGRKRLAPRLSAGARGLAFSAVLLALWPGAARAGQTVQQPPSSGGINHPGVPGIGNEPDGISEQPAGKLEKMREDERRKRLLSDTERLVALSNELQSEVQKTSKDELSLDVVRKATEIEKLAHDVKERMKG